MKSATISWRISSLISMQTSLVCAVIVLISFFLPKNGLGFSACPTMVILGRPCPLCGLTRSIIALSHFDFRSALRYHPFGYVCYLGMIFMTSTLFLPTHLQTTLKKSLHSRRSLDLGMGFAFWGSLLAFGIWRLFWGQFPGTGQ